MRLFIRHLYQFGDFTVDADQRVLLREDKPVPTTPKVFDTLLILIEGGGLIVEKEELMNRLWPDTFVEETNLTFNIKELRKCLGDNARSPLYIETVARRGYRFIAIVEEVLSDSGGGTITGRLGTSDSQPKTAATKLESEAAGSPSVEVESTDHHKLNATNAGSTPADNASSISTGKRSVPLAAAMILVLTGVGFMLWRSSNGADKNLSDNKKVAGKSQLGMPLKIEKLTATGQSRIAAISPDGKYLAYTHAQGIRSAIWLRQLDTNTNVEIVPAADGPIYGLAFASTGEYLYFVRGDPTVLYRVSSLGGVSTRILDTLEGDFSISSDDRQIAFIRQASPHGLREYSLMIANADGSGEHTLLARTHPDRLHAPVWSPDNQSIICSYGDSEGGSREVSIAEISVTDGSKREWSLGKFFHISKILWLPHKSGLILSATKNLEDSNQLWRVSYPGLETSQITEGSSYYLDLSLTANGDKAVASQATLASDICVGSSRELGNLKRMTQATGEFCWTPGGRLVYSSTASGNSDLWIMQPDGTEQRQLTNNPAVDKTPAATPDNRYIVFTSNRTGSLQLWRMNADGGNQIQLTDGAAKDYPAISPDGKWVLYNTPDDWCLWRVSIDGGEPVRLTGYPAYFPSVSPDGKFIACVGGSEPKRKLSILILPFEGGQPLKRFDFSGGGFSKSRIQWTADGKALTYAAERNGPTILIKQSLSGGAPEEVATLGEDELFDFGYSSDGQSLAVIRGGWQHDVVLLTGFNPQ